MDLSIREWICLNQSCGKTHDRDVEKDITEGQKIPRFWIAADDCLETVMPCDVRLF